MKLMFKECQEIKKGLLGGNKGIEFVINARVMFSTEEQDLIKKYQLEGEALAEYQFKLMFSKEPTTFSVTVGSLVNGFTHRSNDLGTVIEIRNKLIDSSKKLRDYLEVASKFGKEYEVDLDHEKQNTNE